MSFIETLNRLMKDNGTSNVALGKALGLSDMAVLRWRKGESSPSLDNAIGVAKYYGITMDQLIGNDKFVDANNFFLMPVIGEVTSDLIQYGLPSGDYVYATNSDLDNYPRSECYVLKGEKEYYYIHQQSQCDNNDLIVYKQTDHISETGLAFSIYSLRRYVRMDDYIELQTLNQNGKKVIYRKQEINHLHIIGVVVNRVSRFVP